HYGSVAVSAAVAPADDMDGLRTFADLLLDKQGGGVVLLGMVHDGKVNFVCKVAKADTKKGLHAGKIIKAAAQAAGGNGGGRPDMAQAGGKEPEKLEAALRAGCEVVTQLLS
ncbi:DHHA1 domain-containing protein, partial [uncultured Megasphaera sp.]